MATGDKSFSTGSVTKTKRSFDPVKAGDYDLKLLKQVEIKLAEPRKIDKGDNAGQMSRPVPRVGIRLEALESAVDGGRNGLIFHDLTTNMTPDKSGTVGPTGADQLKGLADALGEEADIGFVMFQPKGGGEKVKILDPRQLKAWLEERADRIVRAHIKVQAGTKDYPEPKNKLTEFFEAAGSDGAAAADDDGSIPDADGDDEGLDGLPDLDEKSAKKAATKAAPVKGKGKR